MYVRRCYRINDAISTSDYTALNNITINEQHIRKNIEGNGHGQIRGTILASAYTDYGKPQKSQT
jgi:hypothetical protein